MTALSTALNDAKADRSVDQLIDDAIRRGVPINPTARATIYKALKGDHAKNPREDTLELFAAVFQLDKRDLREAVGKPRGELGPWTPDPVSARLSKEQRAALNHLIKTMAGNQAPAPRDGESDDVWLSTGRIDQSLESRLSRRWETLFVEMQQLEIEYAIARGIDRADAFEELLEVWRMFQDAVDGRPWTPPWMVQDDTFVEKFGEDAKPWLRDWWKDKELSDLTWRTPRMKALEDQAGATRSESADAESMLQLTEGVAALADLAERVVAGMEGKGRGGELDHDDDLKQQLADALDRARKLVGKPGDGAPPDAERPAR